MPARAAEPYGLTASRRSRSRIRSSRGAAARRAPAGGGTAGSAARAAGGSGPASATPRWRPRLVAQGLDHLLHPGADLPQGVAQVQPDQGGDLVVAGAAGPQPAAELGRRPARPGRAPARRARPRRSAPAGRLPDATSASSSSRPASIPASSSSVSSPARCSARACAREPGQVVRRQPPVELGGPAEAWPSPRPARPRTGRPTAAPGALRGQPQRRVSRPASRRAASLLDMP